MVGMFLKERDVQYVAHRDETTQTWRILDTWHESLMDLGPDDEIPDDCPGVSIITEGAFIALIKEGARLGVLQNASFSEHATLERDILTKDEDNLELKKQILDLEEQLQAAKQSPHRSEGFELKEMAMQTLLKLTSMSDLERLTKD